jgi:DNA-binding NarL/FixJ family response regulator
MPSEARAGCATAKSQIFIIDDHPIIRQGLAMLINQQEDLAVCGDAEEATAALPLIEALKPNLVMVDIFLHGRDGMDLLKEMRARDPKLPILMLSMLDEVLYAERALRAGASGYIMKQEATAKVLVAIRRILNGETYVSDRIANKMMHQLAGDAVSENRGRIAALTDRELGVFRLIGEGQGTRQIAEALHISVKTVESHQARIKEKLFLKNSRALVQRAVEWVTGTSASGKPLSH